MAKGLPKKYAKMGFKKGWKAYKAKKNSTKRKRTTTKKKPVRRKKRSYKKPTQKKSNGGRGMRLHIGALAGALVPSAVDLIDGVRSGDPAGGMLDVAEGWTGYNADSRTFNMEKPMYYYGSLIAGIVATKLAAKLGVNKYLPKGINI